MSDAYKRVNIMILEAQYEALTQRGLNVSGLIRDLLGDHLSSSTITLQVGDDTRRLYDLVVANTGAADADIEKPLRKALAEVLEVKIAEMQQLHTRLKQEVMASEDSTIADKNTASKG